MVKLSHERIDKRNLVFQPLNDVGVQSLPAERDTLYILLHTSHIAPVFIRVRELTLPIQLVAFIQRIRDEKAFDSPKALAEQIAKDVIQAREIFKRLGSPQGA